MAHTITADSNSSGLAVKPPPWDHNPSSWSHRLAIAVLAGFGFLIASYLTAYQWGWVDSVWDPVFGHQSEQVLDSNVSHQLQRWLGIPDAALGAMAYLGDILFGLAGSTRRWQYRPWLVIVFGIDVIPLGVVGAILVSLQATVVGSWCFLCICSAVISLLLILLAYDEVWSSLLFLRRVWARTHSTAILWNVFWGGASREADALALKRTAA